MTGDSVHAPPHYRSLHRRASADARPYHRGSSWTHDARDGRI